MKVSILIPVFNASRTLQTTLESCVVQGNDIVQEIILVDDHSDDDSKQVFDAVQQNHPEFHWKWALNPKKGACSARNHAFELSTAPFIQWLDADDILGPKKVEGQLKKLQHSQRNIIACPFRPFADNPNSGLLHDPRCWGLEPESSPADWMVVDPMCIPACWLMSRSIAEKAGLWDDSLLVNQDGEYFARVIASSHRVLFQDDVEVFYRREGGGVSKFSPEKADSLYRSVESMAKTAFGIEDSNRMRQMISNRWQHFIYTTYPHAPELLSKAQSKLQHLPTPTLSNPNAVSLLSKIFCALFGWKALTRTRDYRNHLRGR